VAEGDAILYAGVASGPLAESPDLASGRPAGEPASRADIARVEREIIGRVKTGAIATIWVHGTDEPDAVRASILQTQTPALNQKWDVA
jgi:hypothetical protein